MSTHRWALPSTPQRTERTRSLQEVQAAVLWCEPFWIALLAPALLFPGRFWVTALQPLWVVLLFAFWPLRLAGGSRTWRRTPLDLPLALLLAATALALANSPAPPSSWEASGYLLLGVAAALALIQWPPLQAQPQRGGFLLLAGGLAVAAGGALLLGTRSDKLGLGLALPQAGPWAAALGESVNPNVLGGALLIPLLLAAALALGPRWTRGPWQAALGLVAGGLAAELLLTQCRGALLGVAVGLGVIVILRWPRRAWAAVLLGAVGAGVLIWALGLAAVFDALGGGTAALRGGGGLADRISIWQAAVAAIRLQPLQGLGLGLFGPWVTQHGLAGGSEMWQPHAHNLLLQVTADLGIGGLAAYLAVLWATGTMIAALLRARPQYRRVRQGTQDYAGSRQTPNATAGSTAATTTADPCATLTGNISGPGTLQAGARAGGTPARRSRAAVYAQRQRWSLALGSAGALAAVLAHGLVDAALWGNKAAVLPWLLTALVCLLYGAGTIYDET